jgi:hypothetical protein
MARDTTNAMGISDYQVRRVLSIYGRQLLRVKLTSPKLQASRFLPCMRVTITEETQQPLLMDQVQSQAMEQINHRQEDATK